jgi:signal transduction histidine kinase
MAFSCCSISYACMVVPLAGRRNNITVRVVPAPLSNMPDPCPVYRPCALYNPQNPPMLELQAFVDRIGIPLQIVGADRQVIHTNERFNRALGLDPGADWKLNQMSLSSLEGINAESYESALSRAIVTGKSQDCELLLDVELVADSPQERRDTIPARISPVIADDNEKTYLVMLCPYVSGSHRDEAALLRIQRGENLERLASGVAHEFNNLFTGIKGLTDLIKSEVDHSTEIYEFAESIEETVQRGSRLIQQLSSFARDEPYSLVPTEIAEYIQHSRPLLEIQLERGTRLEVELKARGKVMLDVGRMNQALSNLLHNARDALGGKGIVRITVGQSEPPQPATAGAAAEWICVEIADNGPGIPDKLMTRVVEPFFTTKERGKATGLGLSTTIKIVEMHNGVMRVGRSEDLGGASVRIHLPLTAR